MKNIIVKLNKSIADCSSFFDEASKVSPSEGNRYPYQFPKPNPGSRAKNRSAQRGTGEEVQLDQHKIVPLSEKQDVEEVLKKLMRSDDVEEAMEEEDVEPLLDDWDYSNYYEGDKGGMDMSDVSSEISGEGIIVAVLEASPLYGFLVTHRGFGWQDRWPEAWARNIVKYNMHPVFVPFYDSDGNFVNPCLSGNVVSGYGHGTMTASCVVGQGVEDTWGVAPKAKVMAAVGNLSRTIIPATDQGADVISISYTGASFPGFQPAIDYAVSQGVPVVWAHFGNRELRSVDAYEHLIRVGTHDRLGKHWFSYGNLSLTAPGIGIWVNDPLSETKVKKTGGQSLSTPLVAGVVAILLQKNLDWKVSDVYRALQLGAVKNMDDSDHGMGRKTWTEWYGWGMLGAGNSVGINVEA